MKIKAFTLFEVLIALGVFAVAVTGLALALQSAVDAALNARSRMLARTMIESRLASAMANPPLDGRREIEGRTNNGIHVVETFEQAEIRDTNNAILPGMWRLKVTAEPARGGIKETAEILVYRP
ncbi:MAG: prepilin-type N-terminal cleavage/methylation domain-containing protein [Spartobacteria bacterium]